MTEYTGKTLIEQFPYQPGRTERGYVVHAGDDNVGPDHYMLVRICPICSTENQVKVPAQGLWDWEHGQFVQQAMPGLSADDREAVMSGTHAACWDKMFGSED